MNNRREVSETSDFNRRSRTRELGVCLLLLVTQMCGCEAAVDPSALASDGSVGALQEALAMTCGYNECAASVNLGACGVGSTWPGGVLYYKFEPQLRKQTGTDAMKNPIYANMTAAEAETYKCMVRQAAMDWQVLTGATVSFIEANRNGTPQSPVISFQGDAWEGDGTSFAACSSGASSNPTQNCIMWSNADNIYHEWGHTLGFDQHHWRRADQHHYFRENHPNVADCKQAACSLSASNASNFIDFGPFDYKSTMMYFPTHPEFTRWDFSPIVTGIACGAYGQFAAPAGCPMAASCPGVNSSGCSCASCNPKQPQGIPTVNDVSAAIELYKGPGKYENWGKFSRIAKNVGTGQPYSNELAPGVFATETPAISTPQNGSFEIYVRGSNKHIYQKYTTGSSSPATGIWSDWVDLGGNFNTQPAAVSWGSGRTDIFAKYTANNDIYMKTYSNGAWGAWASLGQPSVGIAAAPAATSWGPGRLDVFVRGKDNKLYWRPCAAPNLDCSPGSSNWGLWTQVGSGTFFGVPAAVSRTQEHIDVFVHGMDHKLWSVFYDHSWGYFYQPLNESVVRMYGTTQSDGTCPDCSSPAADARDANIMDVFTRGRDRLMWRTTWSYADWTWSAFSLVGGALSSNPGTITRVRSSNATDIVAFMEDSGSSYENSLWMKTKNWSGPTN